MNFGHMSKLGLPYVHCTLVWTKEKFEQALFCLPYTYLDEKFGHLESKFALDLLTSWVCAHMTKNVLGVKFLFSGRPLNQGSHWG